MTGRAPREIPYITKPSFQLQANDNAMQMVAYSVDELQDMLHVNHEIAAENWHRFQTFHTKENREPAVFCYDGMVFQ